MSTHMELNSGEPRKLADVCMFCDARAGEPCQITTTKYAGQYICPDDDCEQLYEKANDALNCTMRFVPSPQQRGTRGQQP